MLIILILVALIGNMCIMSLGWLFGNMGLGFFGTLIAAAAAFVFSPSQALILFCTAVPVWLFFAVVTIDD